MLLSCSTSLFISSPTVGASNTLSRDNLSCSLSICTTTVVSFGNSTWKDPLVFGDCLCFCLCRWLNSFESKKNLPGSTVSFEGWTRLSKFSLYFWSAFSIFLHAFCINCPRLRCPLCRYCFAVMVWLSCAVSLKVRGCGEFDNVNWNRAHPVAQWIFVLYTRVVGDVIS